MTVSKYSVSLIILFVLVLQTTRDINAQILREHEIRSHLDIYLKEFQKNKLIPGISAGIAVKGKIYWMNASGLADVENNSPATPYTHFRIASISKSITAVAIMQLVEKGRIKLDADARTYIPYFPKKKWKFTVRQLLNHTAGIRNYSKEEFDDAIHYSSIREAVGIVSNDSLVYKPGTKYLYTTLGYNLLGAVIENVSMMSFEEYLKKYIFQPAEMHSTSPDYYNQIIYNRARLYTRDKYRKLENAPLADLTNKLPGGGLLSTTEDLLKFSISLLEGKLIKPETLDSMLVPVRLKNGTLINYGLGFTLGTDKMGRKFFAHEGYSGTSLLVIYPAEKLCAVDLLNIRDRNTGTAAMNLASIVMDHKTEIPKMQLSDKFMGIYLISGIDSVYKSYTEIKHDSTDYYDISLNEISQFGYDLIGIKKIPDAIKYLKFLLSNLTPDAKLYNGLADAYYKDGNMGLALRYYRMALKSERTNVYALSMILKITNTK
jgi:CubicO group peptidase (beta-lactamase class C family)